jgi:hypothetical protein
MKLNLGNIEITPATNTCRSYNKERVSSIKAIYDSRDGSFYTIIEKKRYDLKIVKHRIKFLFSSPLNDVYPKWTAKKTFKNRDFTVGLTPFWRTFYDKMPIKGIVSKDVFIIDVVYYDKISANYYNNQK